MQLFSQQNALMFSKLQRKNTTMPENTIIASTYRELCKIL